MPLVCAGFGLAPWIGECRGGTVGVGDGAGPWSVVLVGIPVAGAVESEKRTWLVPAHGVGGKVRVASGGSTFVLDTCGVADLMGRSKRSVTTAGSALSGGMSGGSVTLPGMST